MAYTWPRPAGSSSSSPAAVNPTMRPRSSATNTPRPSAGPEMFSRCCRARAGSSRPSSTASGISPRYPACQARTWTCAISSASAGTAFRTVAMAAVVPQMCRTRGIGSAPMIGESLSLSQARRIALAAQGFTDPRPTGAVSRRHLRRVLGRIGLLQMDSVNVLMRAHYMPLYSRLGPYPRELIDRAANRAPRELFEYWGHEASLVPVSLQPALRWRMADGQPWQGVARIARERPELVEWVLAEVRAKGPITAAEIEQDVPVRRDHWGWNWTEVKTVLEWLFYRGEVTSSRRNGAWARLYDLPERVLPPDVLDT